MFFECQKTLKKFGPRTWCTKKPFGYWVIYQNSLTIVQDMTITIKMLYHSLFYLPIQNCLSALGVAADCYLKPSVCEQKIMIKYVCCVPALTTTNPLFKRKTGQLKLNNVYKLQIFKFMCLIQGTINSHLLVLFIRTIQGFQRN